MDFGYFMAHDEGLDEAKVREVPRWRESDVFTPVERDVMEYAEAMSVTPLTVDDDLSHRLQDALGLEAVRRAHPAHRAREHALAVQQRRRPAGAGLLGRLRAAPRRTLERVSPADAAGDDARMPGAPDPGRAAVPDTAVPDAAEFEALRPLLFTVAYEMLEVAADAEDVVQEAWLRWSRVDPTTVRDPRAYLVRIVIRLSLNRFRTLSRQRETYVGPWLPEPILTVPDVADDVELADSVSTAMLLVLQTLTPVERAVFVLREVFDVPYDEIAEGVDRTPAAVRQIAHRAREHVAARRPRQRVDRVEHAAVLERFRVAADTGDLQALVDVLAPDVLLVTDGGGVRKAALRPILGRDKVLRFLEAVTPQDVDVELRVELVGGQPGLVAVIDGVVDSVITIEVVDGVVGSLYFVRNPDKLTRLGDEVRLAR